MTTAPELSLAGTDVPAGLRFEVPLDPRPIVIEKSPALQPVLARASAGGFFEKAREGRRVGEARNSLHRAAIAYAMSARPVERDDLASMLTGAAERWSGTLAGTGRRVPQPAPDPRLTTSLALLERIATVTENVVRTRRTTLLKPLLADIRDVLP
ncbi:hypothetical protein [Myceligenerans indicum]|uniref:Uncharacterized protein n=1 Tax=Myceligenerans indicum TaxID=2593663 RepID=A0ABS1LL22_9MICO|nr:hypothetical protein [Myceligenerans indicum]MBL0886719.1 hypothetical protein [Myceligenerans indicum]